MERGPRKWEFVWRGEKISGPVVDEAFYDDFFNHRITIAPGDALSVQLHILQEKHPDIDVYINKILKSQRFESTYPDIIKKICHLNNRVNQITVSLNFLLLKTIEKYF